MAAQQQINSYLSNHYESMSPEQLILMLYKGALSRLKLAREGIMENDIPKKGENISKAIAIISELSASVDTSMNDESTLFLRGLYKAILEELPKANLNNDIDVLNKSAKYISGLKEIWEKDVMGTTQKVKTTTVKASKPVNGTKQPFSGSYGNPGIEKKFQSFSV